MCHFMASKHDEKKLLFILSSEDHHPQVSNNYDTKLQDNKPNGFEATDGIQTDFYLFIYLFIWIICMKTELT